MIQDMVAALLRSVEGSCVSEIEYEFEGHRLRIVRAVGGAGAPAGTSTAVAPRTETPATASAPAAVRPNAVIVRASMHGTFYRSPAPGEAPLVDVGQVVEAGQQLALLEAMKMLHAVEAEEGGRVLKVLADNGAAVEPGTPLFELQPAEAAGV